MGYPASMLMEMACFSYACDEMFILSDLRLPGYKPIPGCISMHKAIHYLENKRLLTTSEISLNEVYIVPNLSTSWYHPEIQAFCWPQLHDSNFEENKNFEPSENVL
jgi:hypothetical protein